MLIEILRFIFGLSILVLIHEFGHFITAKRMGIKVEEFGFGFPPRVFGWKKGETVYSINLLPIGGFVKLYGEDEAGGGSVKTKNHEPITNNLHRAFFARPVWQRAVIVLAGVFMNFVLAVGILTYLFSVPGVAVPKGHVDITGVVEDSPAATAGLKKGDRVVTFNNKQVTSSKALRDETGNNPSKKLPIVVDREGKTQTFTVIPEKKSQQEPARIGVEISDIEVRKYPWYTAPFYGTWEAAKFSYLIVEGIVKTVTDLAFRGIKPEGVAGPVGVYQLSAQAASFGLDAWLWFIALISLNLAVLNILPIPALDGGRLFFILIEGVTGKKISQKYESMAHAVGLALLLGLMALITVQDILRAMSGKSILPTP